MSIYSHPVLYSEPQYDFRGGKRLNSHPNAGAGGANNSARTGAGFSPLVGGDTKMNVNGANANSANNAGNLGASGIAAAAGNAMWGAASFTTAAAGNAIGGSGAARISSEAQDNYDGSNGVGSPRDDSGPTALPPGTFGGLAYAAQYNGGAGSQVGQHSILGDSGPME